MLADLGAAPQSAARVEVAAPGHCYDEKSGSGIEWAPEVIRLWLKRQIIAEAEAPDGSAWDFWYNLRFAETFPQVSHWWFGAPWTGRVRLWPPRQVTGGALSGLMQFVDEEFPMLPWTVWPGMPPLITTPLPPLHAHALNLPLRNVLAAYVAGILHGRVAAGKWRVATSLVPRADLCAVFSLTTRPWALSGINGSYHRSFCQLQYLPYRHKPDVTT